MATSAVVLLPNFEGSTGRAMVMGLANAASAGPIFHAAPTGCVPPGAAPSSGSMVKVTDWFGPMAPLGTKITTP